MNRYVALTAAVACARALAACGAFDRKPRVSPTTAPLSRSNTDLSSEPSPSGCLKRRSAIVGIRQNALSPEAPLSLRLRVIIGGLTAALLAGCAGTTLAPRPIGPLPLAMSEVMPAESLLPAHIKHVVIIIQENRTFENLFAGFPNADAPMFGETSNGDIALHPIDFEPEEDLNHDYEPAITAWNNGLMNAFDKELFDTGEPAGTYPYSY